MIDAARVQRLPIRAVAQKAVVLDEHDVDVEIAGLVEVELAGFQPAVPGLPVGQKQAQRDDAPAILRAQHEGLQPRSPDERADPAPRHIEVDIGTGLEFAPVAFERRQVFKRGERQFDMRAGHHAFAIAGKRDTLNTGILWNCYLQ